MTTRRRVLATSLTWAAFVALIVLLLSTLGLEPDQAQAHALLERSVPAAGTVVPADQPPGGVSLWFSEPVEVAFNGVAVSSSSGRVDRLNARIAADDPRHVEVDLGDAAEGTYLVRWQVTSADNHVVRGSYWFSLGFAAAPPTSAALLGAGAPTAPPMEVAGRWLTLIAVLIVAGAPFFRFLVLRHLEAHVPGLIRAVDAASRRQRQRIWLTVACLLVAAELLWAGAQAEAVAAVPLPQALDTTVLGVVLLGSRFAVLWWARLALGLGAAALLFYEATRQSPDSREVQRTWVAALLSLLLIVSTSLGSHAAGARVLPPLAVGMDVLHLAAAAVWLGALVQLSLLLPSVVRTPPEQRSALLRVLVPRVSTVAFTSVVVLALSGTFNAWEQVGAFEALGSTARPEPCAEARPGDPIARHRGDQPADHSAADGGRASDCQPAADPPVPEAGTRRDSCRRGGGVGGGHPGQPAATWLAESARPARRDAPGRRAAGRAAG